MKPPVTPIFHSLAASPLLHPDITDLVAYAKRLGRFCSLTTNGWLLEKRTRELCDSKLDLLVVSVDGLAEVHNTIRGAGSFEHLSAGLEKMLPQPDRPVIFVNMSLSNLNYNHMLSMYDQALKWQVMA